MVSEHRNKKSPADDDGAQHEPGGYRILGVTCVVKAARAVGANVLDLVGDVPNSFYL
jgi:hypothetical protein